MRSAAAALLLALGMAACAPDALLSPDGAGPRADMAPQITLTPDSAVVGDTGVVLTIRGSGFNEYSYVWIEPWLPQTTTFVDDSTLTVSIGGQLYQAGTYAVSVLGEMMYMSDPASFVVANPPPVITGMTPDWCEIGGDCGTVTLEGRNFMYGMRVQWNGRDVNVSWQSDTRVTFNLDPYQLQWPDLVQITALNPDPTTGPSASAIFQVGTHYMLHTSGARVGSAAFELEIYGENFNPGDSVYWNGSPRQTTVYNARRISAWIPASDVAAPGTGVVTVRSLGDNGGQPFRVGTVAVRPLPYASVTSLLTLELPVRDVVYSPVTERLYATVYDGINASQLAVIDPSTGAVDGYIWVGDSPRYLALTDDGRYLWVGVDGENRVRRVNLQWGYIDMDVALDWGVVAEDLAAVPGRPDRVAVARKSTCCSPWHAGVAVYNGWGGAIGSATAAGPGSNVIEFGMRGATLHGMDTETNANRFRTMRVDDAGVALTYTGWDVGNRWYDMVFAGGRLYTGEGRVIDTGYNDWAGYFQTIDAAVRPDVRTGRAFFLTDHDIRVSDINTFGVLNTLSTPTMQFEYPATQRRHLVRWGTDGLAWHDADQVFILRSPIVAP
ncbi:MAG TPA: IPT/TIG domain-containing protein [Longimicrobium sp.]|nr:IPT/TIG domain-containing protein [Longimicrobium sp.]